MSATESPAEILERLHRERQQEAERRRKEIGPTPAPRRTRTPSREQLNAFWETIELRDSIERDHLDVGLWTDP